MNVRLIETDHFRAIKQESGAFLVKAISPAAKAFCALNDESTLMPLGHGKLDVLMQTLETYDKLAEQLAALKIDV